MPTVNVLVTGAGGYIGSHLVKWLARDADIQTTAMVRPGSSLANLRGLEKRVVFGDLLRPDGLQRILQEVDIVYHLAAATSGSHYEMMMNTVVATAHLLDALVHCRPRRLVLVSSLSVYQMTSLKAGSVLDENCPLESNLWARDAYTITKVRQENLVRKKCQQMALPLVIIRPGKIYGPGIFPWPPQMGLNVPGICFLYIGGKSLLPLTHVANCASAIALAGTVTGVDDQVFNIVDDDLFTQRQFLSLYRAVMGGIPRTVRIPYRLFRLLAFSAEIASRKTRGNIPSIITRYRAENLWKSLRYDNTKAKSKLGWRPTIRIESGLMETFATLKNAMVC